MKTPALPSSCPISPASIRPSAWKERSLKSACLAYFSEVGEVSSHGIEYSDGLVETHDPKGEMFGFPRLRTLVAEHSEGRVLGESLLEELYSFVGEDWEQEDDITLLTLRRSPSLS